ncbi:2-dehydro-3-deoxy-D-gluconate 5-dehydrogenase KduD [Arthrobacter tecti]
MNLPFDLQGKRALVTGASKGIGFCMAEALAAAGADIVGASRSLPATGSHIEAAVERQGRNFTGMQVDLSCRDEAQAFAAQAAEMNIDILVNNAGTIYREPAARHSLERWDEALAVNLTSQFILTQALGQRMLEVGYGKILFTASLLSFQGGINVPGYTATKSALSGLIKALSNEWAGSGITVNGIAPGYIATDNTQALREDPDRASAILERIPAGRWGQPSDLAGATVFLASHASDYVSGCVLPVDGGWLGR